eukprot:COSAG02_NODE_57847_length_279_cov_0.744444_1_plen_42_part_01
MRAVKTAPNYDVIVDALRSLAAGCSRATWREGRLPRLRTQYS